MSDSSPGELAWQVVPAPGGRARRTAFKSQAEIAALIAKLNRQSAVFCAAPHGAAAALIDSLLKAAEAAGTQAALRRHLRGLPLRHGGALRGGVQACARRAASARAVHLRGAGAPEEGDHAARRRIRAASPRRSCWPACRCCRSGSSSPRCSSAASPAARARAASRSKARIIRTRHSDLYSYGALGHRHTPEITALRQGGVGRRGGVRLRAALGPVRARHSRHGAGAPQVAARRGAAVAACCASTTRAAPFVRVLDNAPRVKDIVASNYAHLSAAANGRTVAVMSVVDNLNKGAAGGAVQWMNRLFGLPETAGLTAPAAGWT